MIYLLSFILAMLILVGVHEWAHFAVARLFRVKVLKFSLGFGKSLLRYRAKKSGTEYALGAIPLGGYVRMLDEAEGDVPSHEKHLAFNNQHVAKRFAIVAAGPLANLILAVALFAVLAWWGAMEPVAVLEKPLAGSFAQLHGLRGGEQVLAVEQSNGKSTSIASYDALAWALMQGAIDKKDLLLRVKNTLGATQADAAEYEIALPLSQFDYQGQESAILQQMGLTGPMRGVFVQEVVKGGAAELAGLQQQDEILRVNDQPITDTAAFVAQVQAAGKSEPAQTLQLQVQRAGQLLSMAITPKPERQADGALIGKIGAGLSAVEMQRVRYGLLGAFAQGVQRTWDSAIFMFKMLGKIITGQASVKNLSGPITIADYAGKSATLGLERFLAFLALISVSLGVMNLLPIPMLDGGHLAMYAAEGLRGKPLSPIWMQRMQRVGMAVLMLLMGVAMFNDISRYMLQ